MSGSIGAWGTRRVKGAAVGRHADWLSKTESRKFERLFDRVVEIKGTITAARSYIGIGTEVYEGIRSGRISHASGKKILEAYERAKRQQERAKSRGDIARLMAKVDEVLEVQT